MNKTHTLKELADIGAKVASSCLPDGVRMCVLNGAPPHHVVARQAFTKAVLDAVGYKLPVDPEREAFDAWVAEHGDGFMPCGFADKAFVAWKAGRDNLRKYRQERAREALPPWIEWKGGKSPITGARTRFEIEYRDGERTICTRNTLCWSHYGVAGDIIAYRIIY